MGFDKLAHYRELINSLPDIIYQIDPQGRFEFAGNAFSLLGYAPGELIGKHFDVILHPDDRLMPALKPESGHKRTENARVVFNERREKVGALETVEIRLLHKRFADAPKPIDSDAVTFGELSARGFYETEKSSGKRKFLGTIGVIRDITRRKKSEGLLRRLLSAVDQTPVSIIITDSDGVIDYINPQFIRTSGYTPQEVIGRKVSMLKSHYHPEEFYRALNKSLHDSGEWTGEIINKKKNGAYYWNSIIISAVRDPEGAITNFISIQEDITEKKRTEKQIKSLREKEILLREIHHRVKNNLQIITSLLNLQSNAITEEKFIEIFRKCEDRVKTMALIHEKLYQSEDIARIEFGDYLKTLIFHLRQAHREDLERITINVNVDTVYFDIDTAIPAGLIVNELVTNAFFHAFPNKRRGTIEVRLTETDDHSLIEVSDNGRGFKEDLENSSGDGLGLQLVSVLVKQLHGSLTLEKKAGTCLRLVIPGPEWRDNA